MNLERALAIDGRTGIDDLEWLASQSIHHPVIIEIGAFKGRSARALADNCYGRVYTIDNWNASINRGKPDGAAWRSAHENLADLIASEKVVLIHHDSQEGVPDLLRFVTADMLWIDGDHSYAAVKSDIQTFAPLVKRGGLVCGHDYSVWHPEVMQAVDELYGDRVRSLGIHRSIWWVHV